MDSSGGIIQVFNSTSSRVQIIGLTPNTEYSASAKILVLNNGAEVFPEDSLPVNFKTG